jgi:hypothetical protein
MGAMAFAHLRLPRLHRELHESLSHISSLVLYGLSQVELHDLVGDPYELDNPAFDPTLETLEQDLAAQLAIRLTE